MKKTVLCAILSLCILLSFLGMLYAEQSTDSESDIPPAIRGFIEGLNKHSYGIAKPHISPDFTIDGVPQEFTKQALQQVFGSFNRSVAQYLYKSQKKGYFGTVYTIRVLVGNHTTDVEFELDKDGKVLSCSMFRAQTPEDVMSQDNLKLNPYAELEFELINDIIILPVKLNGEDVQFILDTGAPMLVLNSSVGHESDRGVIAGAQGIGGSIQNMGFTTVRSISWAGGSNSLFDAVTMDLSHLEEEVGRKFHGLLSKAELEPFETVIDYQAKKLYLYLLKDNGAFAEKVRLPKPRQVIKFKLSGHIACVNAKIGKQKLVLGMDTGAQTNLLDDDYFTKMEGLYIGVQTDTLSGAGPNSSVIKTGIFPDTKVGQLTCKDMRYAFSDISEMNQAYNLNIDGLLGYPFLSQFKTSINYRKKTLSIY